VILPKKLILFKHPRELDGKSTAIHAKLVSPDDVSFIVSDCTDLTQTNLDSDRTLLLFPSEQAQDVKNVEFNSFDQVIVVDGTWRQAKTMTRLLSKKFTRHVKIQNHSTLFWRYQKFSMDYLATIEAIYWFYRELLSCASITQEYNGQVDNLLYYFKAQYETVQEHYKNHPELVFTRKKLDSVEYIHYSNET
jgi:DTW domain-containing protein YfiP